jgi:hypothetical protein
LHLYLFLIQLQAPLSIPVNQGNEIYSFCCLMRCRKTFYRLFPWAAFLLIMQNIYLILLMYIFMPAEEPLHLKRLLVVLNDSQSYLLITIFCIILTSFRRITIMYMPAGN